VKIVGALAHLLVVLLYEAARECMRERERERERERVKNGIVILHLLHV